MVLQVTDKNKTITTVEIMMFELDNESNVMKVWDYADNTATITMDSSYRAEQCARNLYSGGKAQVEGEIDWN